MRAGVLMGAYLAVRAELERLGDALLREELAISRSVPVEQGGAQVTLTEPERWKEERLLAASAREHPFEDEVNKHTAFNDPPTPAPVRSR
jgi:hypothetical protein